MLKGFCRNFGPLQIATEEQIEAIHRGTLDVLRETGIRFESKKALRLFEKNDCMVDHGKSRVRFPEGLVEECLRKCPSSFRVKARDSKNDVVIGGNTVYFRNFPGMQTVDLNTWEPRTATREEYYDYVTILDALDNCHIIGGYPYFGFEGISEVMKIPEGVAAKIRRSTKIQFAAYSRECEMFNIEMAQAAGTEIFGIIESAPPLTFYGNAVENALRTTRAGFPMMLASGLVYGATGPATIAGSIISNNAENLASMVLLQLMRPRMRVVAKEFTFPQDMRTGSPVFGAIGISLHGTMMNQLYRHYRIPIVNASLAPSSSKSIDFQCGYERGIGALAAAVSGASIIDLHGAISSELTAHPVQAILDRDIAGMIGRFLEGVEVSDETLALDLIEEVGPIPGMFLDKEHTRKWWKKEQFIPKAADRRTYPDWMKTEKKSALDYAKEEMEQILATHKPTPLTPGQDQDIERILEEARQYYRRQELL